jgi:hypothetical protein
MLDPAPGELVRQGEAGQTAADDADHASSAANGGPFTGRSYYACM